MGDRAKVVAGGALVQANVLRFKEFLGKKLRNSKPLTSICFVLFTCTSSDEMFRYEVTDLERWYAFKAAEFPCCCGPSIEDEGATAEDSVKLSIRT